MIASKITFRLKVCTFREVKPQIFSIDAFGARVLDYVTISQRSHTWSTSQVLKL